MKTRTLLVMMAIGGCLLSVFGCAREAAESGSVEIRDGVEIVRNGSTPLHPNRRVVFEEDLVIGSGNDQDEIRLFRPRAYAVDSRGFIYISDDMDPGIRVFDPEGHPVRIIGTKGAGPGEFQLIVAMAVLPDDRLLVLDSELKRTSLFDPDGRFLSSYQWADRGSSFRIHFAADAFYVREVTTMGPGETPETWKRHLRVVAFDYGGREIRSFGDFEDAQSGFVPKKFSFTLPYQVLSVLTGDGPNRRLYHCHNDRYLIQVFDETGTIIRVIHRPYERRQVTPEDWTKYLDGFRTSAERRAEIEKAALKPRLMPVTDAMIVDDAGRLWVSTPPEIFDVFDREGHYEACVRSPFVPGLFRGGKAFRFETDAETGERRLKRYRVTWIQ